jgi:hypothetical protein
VRGRVPARGGHAQEDAPVIRRRGTRLRVRRLGLRLLRHFTSSSYYFSCSGPRRHFAAAARGAVRFLAPAGWRQATPQRPAAHAPPRPASLAAARRLAS